MASPFASTIRLSEEQSQALQALLRSGSTPQALVFRAQIVVRANAPDGASNVQISGELGCDRRTVSKWRERFAKQGLAGLVDAPRTGRPLVFSPRGPAGGDRAGEQLA